VYNIEDRKRQRGRRISGKCRRQKETKRQKEKGKERHKETERQKEKWT
jgi:hypothetical protein